MNHSRDRRGHWLIAIPLGVYVFAYVYLSAYHQRLWLFDVVVHEGGTLTLLQTVFYASHFLGHLPSLTVIALLFAGAGLALVRLPKRLEPSPRTLLTGLALLLIFSTIVAVVVFGWQDALAYITQNKQGTAIYAKGGSWNLHLPSTVVLFVLIPPYIFVVARIFRMPLGSVRRGALYFVAAAALSALFALLFNRGSLSAIATAFTDPRYLAHSIRELATFTLTFFPLPLYLLTRSLSREGDLSAGVARRMPVWIVVLFAIATAVVVYQCWVALTAGIGHLAQKPAFAKSGTLCVPYLLASHYFEHVLDSIYFTLLTLLFWSVAARRQVHAC